MAPSRFVQSPVRGILTCDRCETAPLRYPLPVFLATNCLQSIAAELPQDDDPQCRIRCHQEESRPLKEPCDEHRVPADEEAANDGCGDRQYGSDGRVGTSSERGVGSHEDEQRRVDIRKSDATVETEGKREGSSFGPRRQGGIRSEELVAPGETFENLGGADLFAIFRNRFWWTANPHCRIWSSSRDVVALG